MPVEVRVLSTAYSKEALRSRASFVFSANGDFTSDGNSSMILMPSFCIGIDERAVWKL
ncbi:hypothetical protein [Paenibacillus rhizophilus]|uniref:hypothetical protein n=1 Tax=Paenibacillus rhizophilus TaxID=1850366 RepID=UPI0016399DFF|nr:hypothetical protein [Paenibacillus rhizophilus]